MGTFSSRCAIERLRGGLLDTVAVKHLTMEEEQIKAHFCEGLQDLDAGRAGHLCICGSYGQGKSHTLAYLNHQALSQGYASSFVQLDLREIPLHRFPVVYQAVMEHLSLPDGKKFSEVWRACGTRDLLDLVPHIPHRFYMTLLAMLCKDERPLSKRAYGRKNIQCRQKEVPYWLERVVMGDNLPLTNLKSILRYYGILEFQKTSLRCVGNLPYIQMIQVLGTLLKQMGYKGLILLFDEVESIAQTRLKNRAKSYEVLDYFFQGAESVYPIFACTDDFFAKVDNEQYDDEESVFSQNYAKTWRNVTRLRLQEFSSDSWKVLQNRLLELYAEAYHIDLSNHLIDIQERLHSLCSTLEGQETRLKLKALVHQLDIETQQYLLGI